MGALDGKVAIVTGASRGIGKGCALELGAAGATVYVTGRTATGATSVEVTATEIDELGGRGIGVACDHGDDDAVRALFERVIAEQGRLDIVVNNAFKISDELTSGLPFWEVPISNWDDMIDIGTRSAYVATVLAAPTMVAQGSGFIANISSSGAAEYAWHVAYGVGKAALDRLTADTAHELSQHGVSVVSVWPGLVRTERIEEALAAGTSIPTLDYSTSETPRFTGRAVAAMAADPDVAALTGQAVTARDMADRYSFTDIDGTMPQGPLKDRKTS